MDNQIISTVSLKLANNEEAVISVKKKSHKPGFIMVGNGKTNKKGVDSIDLLIEVADMSSNEKLCFFLIKDGVIFDPWDNRLIYQVRIDTSKLTKSQKSKFSNGFNKLKDKDLVKRVSRGVYMINPNALIPNDYVRELHIWETI